MIFATLFFPGLAYRITTLIFILYVEGFSFDFESICGGYLKCIKIFVNTDLACWKQKRHSNIILLICFE